MSKKIGRGALAALAAGAMALTLGSAASASVVDPDSPIISVPQEKVGKAEIHRIADSEPILTAVKASKSATWGNVTNWAKYQNVWDCQGNYPQNSVDRRPTSQPAGTKINVPVVIPQAPWLISVECVSVTEVTKSGSYGTMDIIVSRHDDYPDALAATPLADVLNAPVLLHPSSLINGKLVPQVEAEIARLAKVGESKKVKVTVHLLGGTDALSHAVENAIDNIPNVDRTLRYQGTNRFETATNIAAVTVGHYGIDSGAGLKDVNAYLTTGLDFPDALSAGAAASDNDGVVILTNGTGWDQDGFSRTFITNLRNWVNDNGPHNNTSEVFAVGGPSAAAAAGADGIRLAGAYVGDNRFQTAALTAKATFNNPHHFAIASGETFEDALVASGFIANSDGPLLLTENAQLSSSYNPFTAEYLRGEVEDGDTLVVFGGPYGASPQVSADVKALLDELFKLPSW